ncbi:MAG: EAL and HDOD domain-containing protein [Planctomycetota bacterium]|jgi:EAL and modified HD-GYP domain-containing signal transduction protein
MHTFVGRQPIFDQRLNIYGYELLFRAGLENVFPNIDGNVATSTVIANSFFDMGLDRLTGGRRVFINFTKNLLLDGTALLLPQESLIIEILEDVAPDAKLFNAIRVLKKNGYTVALDDFTRKHLKNPLIGLADIIKVDFMATTEEDQTLIAQQLLKKNCRLLAEKVETQEEFTRAESLGYTLFQGYFYCKPMVVKKAAIPESKMSRIRLLEAVNRSPMDLPKLEEIIRNDLAFSYKLLRYINSAYFGLRQEVSNIKQALVLLGQNKLRKWASLIICAFLGENKPSELLVTSIVRGRFCELMAEHSGMKDRSNEMFLMGMFSIIDALLDMPMDKVLQEIALADDLKDALLGEPNPLRDIFDVAVCYEQGNWEQLASLSKNLKFDQARLPEFHQESANLAQEILQFEAAGTQTSKA